MIGTTLGHYRITAKIGEGGMGEVYRAHDEKLDRDVAVKVLPEAVTQDAGRLARFETEAKAVAALNHPNIVTIFSVEEDDGVHFITMELVEGKTLSELIPRKGMPIAKLLGVAIPLANAVSTAHEKGIIHRDLKPDNLMVNDEGLVKILDFGLAKLRGDTEEAPSITKLPTESATQPGRIAGTAAYMSPEQAEGKTIDQRSDIFSLGIVLYEMATGLCPFTGDSTASTLSAILRDTPPPVTELNPALPSLFARIVRRCLVKDPERRYQNVKDLRNELEELKQDLASGEMLEGAVAAPPSAKWKWMLAVAGAAVAAVVVTYSLLQTRRDASTPIQGEFTRLTTLAGMELFPTLSPDGEFLVYASRASGNWDIYLLRVGGENALNLTKDTPERDTQPALSPNGTQIAFRSERQGGGIFTMGATGESVRRLTDVGYNPAWSPDGEEIAYAKEEGVWTSPDARLTSAQLWAVNVSAGSERLITGGDAVQPSWSPNGSRIAYWGLGDPLRQTDRQSAPRDTTQRDIWTVPAGGGEPHPVTNDRWLDWNPVWSHDGRHLYFSSDRGGTLNLWRVPINEVSGQVLGEPVAVTTPSTWVGHVSVSRDGRKIAYISHTFNSNLYKIAFNPETGSVAHPPIPVLEDSRLPITVDLSSDGRQLVTVIFGKYEDIAIVGSDGTGFRKLTDDLHKDRAPRWSPHDELITFYSDRSGSCQIWSIHPDGSGLRQMTDGPLEFFFSTWSPDGTQIYSDSWVSDWPQYRGALWNPARPWREQTPQTVPSLASENGTEQWLNVGRSDWSPDGRKIAGTIGEPGEIAIFDLSTQQYRVVTDLEAISGDHATGVRWLSDSRRLLYLDQEQETLRIFDTETRTHREVLFVGPDWLGAQFCLTKSNDFIYFTRGRDEADIWMLTLDVR